MKREKEPVSIVYLECPDGTKLISLHQHNFQSHTDTKNTYSGIDGGQENHHITIHGEGVLKRAPIQKLIEQIRVQFEWGMSTNKKGEALYKTYNILLCDLETSHIKNILKLPKVKKSFSRHYFKAELEFRKRPKPLFISEDGVEIYEGDTVYCKNMLKAKIIQFCATKYTVKNGKFSSKNLAWESLIKSRLYSWEDMISLLQRAKPNVAKTRIENLAMASQRHKFEKDDEDKQANT